MAFLCVCPEKSLEFGADEKLHRCTKEQFIRGVLESVNSSSGKKAILTLPGGGIAVESSDDTAPKIAADSDSSTIGALTGQIQNYAYLVKKYLQHELHLPHNVTLEAVRERMPVSVSPHLSPIEITHDIAVHCMQSIYPGSRIALQDVFSDGHWDDHKTPWTFLFLHL